MTFTRQAANVKDGVTTVALTLVALAMRLWHLSTPKGFIFDEVYYAKNAHSLVLHGVELKSNGSAEFIVHPPVGKWLIGFGIKLFGFNEFGWRFASALIGALSVGLMFLVAKKLFNNYFLATTAAALMSLDGIHLVHSRVALLDIFLMFFILLAFFFILNTQPWFASIALGLALATKWSGIYYLVAFGLFMLYSDYRQEKAKESDKPLLVLAKKNLWLRLVQFGILPVFVYVFSWIGWFRTSVGWDRTWSSSVAKSFIHYHAEMWNFHTHLTDSHAYSANPWTWLIMSRPTSFFYASPKGCGASACSQEIIALGTPLIWWSAVVALFVTFGYWLARREWQSGLVLLSFAAGYLPWFFMQKRTMFTFYAIAFEPFIILLIIFAISKALESDGDAGISKRRLYLVYGYLAAVAINFWYFYPLYMGSVISYTNWIHHMWIPSWI